MRFGDALKARLNNSVAFFTRPNAHEKAAIAGSKADAFLEVLTASQWTQLANPKTKELLGSYDKNPWVRAIVDKISKGVARQDWYFEDASGKRIDKHPALDFLRNGSTRLTAKAGITATVQHLLLAGESFWAIGRDAKGKPVEFAPVPPHWVVDTPNAGLMKYRIQPRSQKPTFIEPEDMLVFRDASPLDPYGRGGSITSAAWAEIKADENAAEYLASFFENRARPDIIVTGTDDKNGAIPKAQIPELSASWMEKFRGLGRNSRPLFSAKALQVHEIGSGLKDNDVGPIRETLKAAIFETFGVPPEIFGRLESSNRATIDSANYLFGLHSLMPRLELLCDTLVPFFEREFVTDGLKLKFVSPITDDRPEVLQVMQSRPMAFSDNEARHLAGLPPRPGLDDLPEPPAALDPNADPADPNADPDGDPENDPPKGSKPKPDPKGDGEKPKALPEPVTRSMSPDDIFIVSDAANDPQVRLEASRILDKVMRDLLAKYGDELLAELEADVTFEVNSMVADWLIQRGSDLLGEVNSTTSAALRRALNEGASAGEDVEALVSRVESIFEQAADIRSAIIGDTEATAIAGYGSIAGARQGGFESKQWLSSHDQKVRASHQKLDGKVVLLNEYFRTDDGAAADYPGGFGDPAEDINCRCATRPVLPGEKSLTKAQKAKFARWHSNQLDKMGAALAHKMQLIFHGQAEVTKAALRAKLRK